MPAIKQLTVAAHASNLQAALERLDQARFGDGMEEFETYANLDDSEHPYAELDNAIDYVLVVARALIEQVAS